MDPKAAAKAKRSHTVRGRRTHQTPAAAAAHRQKRAADAAASSGPRARNLPSNWDRYDEEPEADDSAPPSEWTGEVPPRSKGSDFSFLLEQARAQPREAAGQAAPWLAFKDSPFDFMQASTSMLEAKGEGILSWCEDDNFILEDDLAPDFEVPFLTMDLHKLAFQLSKLKLSQRLFIEEDFLPQDLADASEDNQIQIQHDTHVESDAKDSSVHHKDEIIHDYDRNIRYEEEKTTPSHKISTQLEQLGTGEDKSYTRIKDVPGTSHSEGARFEVVAAEEELDMLLNSISGTHLSMLDESTLEGMRVSESNEKTTHNMSSGAMVLPTHDDALDGLLSETSVSVQNEGFAASGSTSRPTFSSDHNMDFRYAKQIDVTASIDDSVDGLLADTSLFENEQKQTTSAQVQGSISSVSVPPPGPSNVSDDFDSWFDSL